MRIKSGKWPKRHSAEKVKEKKHEKVGKREGKKTTKKWGKAKKIDKNEKGGKSKKITNQICGDGKKKHESKEKKRGGWRKAKMILYGFLFTGKIVNKFEAIKQNIFAAKHSKSFFFD